MYPFTKMQNTPTPNTKLVAITLVAKTRQEYREVIEVPADTSDYELAKIVDARYQAVDPSEFTEDREYWERGDCNADSDVMASEKPILVVTRKIDASGGSFQFERPVATAEAVQPEAVDRNLLALNFAKLMVAALTAEELQQANTRNRANGYVQSTCATHDFLDANEVMLQALALTTGVPDAELDLDTNNAAMNYAWQMAKACDFDANRVLLLAAQSQLNASFGQSGDNQTGALAQELSKFSGVAIGPQEELIVVSSSDASQPDAGAEPDPYEGLSCGKYHILVEIPAKGPMEDLVAGLQRAYDAGVAGNFKVLVTRNPGWLVVFEREINHEEVAYLNDRLIEGAEDLQRAAMAQLASELALSESPVTSPVIEDLRNGDAQIVDFDDLL